MRRRQFERLMDKWDRDAERRHEAWLEEMREWREAEERRSREWWAEWRAYRVAEKRRLDAIDAAVANETRLTRDILIQMREDRKMMRDMRHGIQATTEGLLRVLDEFRRGDGPSAAGA